MRYVRYLLPLCCLVALLLTGCGLPVFGASAANNQGTLAGLTFHRTAYTFGAWPQGDNLYYVPGYSPTAGLRDEWGVRMYKASDGTLYNHPVLQAQDALALVARYQHDHTANLLTIAETEARRLIAIHTTQAFTGQAWWYPYTFDFQEYGEKANTARAPWFSGMAQGEALRLFTELYEVTHETRWQDAAQHTFQSFMYPLLPKEDVHEHPWVWRVDNDGWLWIEEYPTPNINDNTINGFGFALYGIIEYARTFHDAQAVMLAQGGLTTFAHAIPLVRHPGGVSSYSLSHMKDLSAKYHLIVTHQLRLFAGVTGDKELATLANDFTLDYPEDTVRR